MFALKFFLLSIMVESFDSLGAKGDDLQGLRKYRLQGFILLNPQDALVSFVRTYCI